MHAIENPSPFKAIPVGFTASTDQIDLWIALQDKRKASVAAPLSFDRWIMGLSVQDTLTLNILQVWEIDYGTVALDNMLRAMEADIRTAL